MSPASDSNAADLHAAYTFQQQQVERLRIHGRELAHLASDLTSLTFSVPLDTERIQRHVEVMDAVVQNMRRIELPCPG